ncbi:hypothetical protein [Roseburia sp. 499]|uniref:hypothetical protein n=1 Tax=Roseburia sp. 499 TaxID=1261634 RepID=UPI000950FC83|nr:hypothetical protein [Roseburia sp. 499]WVK70916.1 hypothetical protein BIV20_05120 [Roseburia sp. 499]
MKRDFSDASKEELINLVAQVESEKWCDFTDWIGDRWCDFESWIGALDIQHYINDVNAYHKKVIDKNNTTVQEIENIFNAVKEVDTSYAVRMSACKEQLESIGKLILELTKVVDPSTGVFRTDVVNGRLTGFFSDYEKTKEILLILGQTGLTQEELEELDDEQLKNVLSRVISGVIDVLPNIKVGDKLQVPIGPDVTLYYSVSGKYDNDSDIDIDLVISDQRLKLKEMSWSKNLTDGVSIDKGLVGGDVDVSAKTDNGSVKFSSGGACEMEGTYKNGDTTYKVKTSFAYEKMILEESVATEIGKGTITSTIGIEKTKNNGWTPCPVTVYETEVVEIPEIEDTDDDWETVVFVVGGIICVGGLILAIPTGGASLGLCVL